MGRWRHDLPYLVQQNVTLYIINLTSLYSPLVLINQVTPIRRVQATVHETGYTIKDKF